MFNQEQNMVHPVPQEKDERYYIDLAESDETWQQIKASYALEGVELTEENAALAGRMIAGEISLSDAMAELHKVHGTPSKLALVH